MCFTLCSLGFLVLYSVIHYFVKQSLVRHLLTIGLVAVVGIAAGNVGVTLGRSLFINDYSRELGQLADVLYSSSKTNDIRILQRQIAVFNADIAPLIMNNKSLMPMISKIEDVGIRTNVP